MHSPNWQMEKVRLEPGCGAPSCMSHCVTSLTCSSLGRGGPRVWQPHAQPPHPSIFAEVWPLLIPQGTLVSLLCSHVTRGKRKTNPQTQAKQPHTCHRFPWWIFPLPLSTEEPANQEKKLCWGLGSCGPGRLVARGRSGQHIDQPNAISSFCISLEKCQESYWIEGPQDPVLVPLICYVTLDKWLGLFEPLSPHL